jgi:8-oxo-dGTP pyrophosphatase MutT (NUDIX family)
MALNHISSGGVLLNSQNQVYLIHKIERDEWLLPKGIVEENEKNSDTALREIKEETGFNNLELVYDFPISLSHYNFLHPKTSEEIDKYVSFFIIKSLDSNQVQTQEMKDEGLEGNFFTFEEALQKCTFEDSKIAIKNAQKILQKTEVDLFLLGGQGIHNFDWIFNISKKFQTDFPNNQIIYYDHWTNYQKLSMNIEKEAQKLSMIATPSTKFKIFAKSAGIWTVLKAIKDYDLKPEFCVFVGFPSEGFDAQDLEIKNYLQNFPVKAYLFQNSNDLFGSFEKTKNILEKNDVTNIKIIESFEEGHNYNNLQEYKKLLLE